MADRQTPAIVPKSLACLLDGVPTRFLITVTTTKTRRRLARVDLSGLKTAWSAKTVSHIWARVAVHAERHL